MYGRGNNQRSLVATREKTSVGNLDPESDQDPLVRGADPDPAPPFSHDCVKLTEIMPAI